MIRIQNLIFGQIGSRISRKADYPEKTGASRMWSGGNYQTEISSRPVFPLTVLKKDFTKEQLKKTTAYQAMEQIGIFYKIEDLEAFFEWLHTLEDGNISIDNLAAERALKNFATGRRDWLLAKSIRGALVSAGGFLILLWYRFF